ncbi:glycosyltransferase [bacterium]|nr:glycosyltransferase [bacterium]
MNEPSDTIFLSVVIPCYNEARNIEAGRLAEVCVWLRTRPYTHEVIIVDDGSTDESLALLSVVARKYGGVTVLETVHRGKPFAVKAGVEEARGAAVLLTDLDQSTPIEELSRLLVPYEQGYDAVIGSRGKARLGHSAMRKAGSRLFGLLRRLVILPQIEDTQCGFKLFRKSVLVSAFPRLGWFSRPSRARGWRVSAWDVELLYVLQESGTRIKEVEVAWRNRDCSDSKGAKSGGAKYIAESLEMAVEVLRVAGNRMRGTYKNKV